MMTVVYDIPELGSNCQMIGFNPHIFTGRIYAIMDGRKKIGTVKYETFENGKKNIVIYNMYGEAIAKGNRMFDFLETINMDMFLNHFAPPKLQ